MVMLRMLQYRLQRLGIAGTSLALKRTTLALVAYDEVEFQTAVLPEVPKIRNFAFWLPICRQKLFLASLVQLVFSINGKSVVLEIDHSCLLCLMCII